MKKLSFEDWYDEYESKVEEKLKMDGRYYELCFDIYVFGINVRSRAPNMVTVIGSGSHINNNLLASLKHDDLKVCQIICGYKEIKIDISISQ